MAALNAIAREWADELREGIAWVIVWKTGRSWNAQAVWLNCDDDTFEPEDYEHMHELMAADRQHEDAQQVEHPPDDEPAELRSPPTMDLTLTLTPDTASALLDAITPQIVKLWESVKSWVNEAAKALGKIAAAIGKAAATAVNNFVDAMLYNANDRPKRAGVEREPPSGDPVEWLPLPAV